MATSSIAYRIHPNCEHRCQLISTKGSSPLTFGKLKHIAPLPTKPQDSTNYNCHRLFLSWSRVQLLLNPAPPRINRHGGG